LETDQQHPGLQGGLNSWQVQPGAQDVLQSSDVTAQGTLSAAAPTMCGPGEGPVAPPEAGDNVAALPMDGGSGTTAVSSVERASQGGPVAPAAVAAPAGDTAVEGEAPGSPGGAYTMQVRTPQDCSA
jgi:hypothetical protein